MPKHVSGTCASPCLCLAGLTSSLARSGSSRDQKHPETRGRRKTDVTGTGDLLASLAAASLAPVVRQPGGQTIGGCHTCIPPVADVGHPQDLPFPLQALAEAAALRSQGPPELRTNPYKSFCRKTGRKAVGRPTLTAAVQLMSD